MRPTFYSRFGKRWFDAAAAAAGLCVLSPLLVAAGIAVRLTSSGPALFSQVRGGRFGKPFRILKFRTMRQRREGSDSLITAAGDPRVTPLGRWLRKTKIDELPQLLNVLAGQMSLVGPRPEVPFYIATYSERQRLVLNVRPGVTTPGINFDEEKILAQSDDPESYYRSVILPGKIESDLLYCGDIRFGSDLRIIVDTLAGVMKRFRRANASVQTEYPDASHDSPFR